MRNITFDQFSALDIASLILSATLLLCLFKLPYGFYTIIRLATAIIAICWAVKFYNHKKTALSIIAIGIGVLFQPLIKITLDRMTWNIVDVCVAIGLIVLIVRKHYKNMPR